MISVNQLTRMFSLTVALYGCTSPSLTVLCGGIVCPPNSECVNDDDGQFLTCASPETQAACVGAADGDRCSTGEIASGRCENGACRPLVCFEDDFSTELDRDRYDFYSLTQTTVVAADGKLVIDIAPLAYRYNGVVTVDGFDLTNGSMQAWVEPPSTPNSEAYFEVSVHLGLKFTMIYQNGNLRTQFIRGGGESNGPSIPYDPIAHRYWQIKNAEDTIQYATSADGETWALRHELTDSASFASYKSVKLVLTAGSSTTAGGRARFDDLEIVTPICAGL